MKSHLPQYQEPTGKDISLDKKIDYVVRCPRTGRKNSDAFTSEPVIGGLNYWPTPLNPYSNESSNDYVVGMGLEIKDEDGSRAEAECQITVWCTAYLNWMRHHREGTAKLQPLVACVMVGHLFDFYIAYAIKDSTIESFQVVCPIAVDLLC